MCDTVVDFNVCVQIASRIQSRVWTDSSERERDSGMNLCFPEINCRPPSGGQNCNTVDDSSVSDVLAKPVVARFYRTAPSGSAILERIFGPPKSTADPHWGARTVILSTNPASASRLQAEFSPVFEQKLQARERF